MPNVLLTDVLNYFQIPPGTVSDASRADDQGVLILSDLAPIVKHSLTSFIDDADYCCLFYRQDTKP